MNKVWGGVLVVTGFIACPCPSFSAFRPMIGGTVPPIFESRI